MDFSNLKSRRGFVISVILLVSLALISYGVWSLWGRYSRTHQTPVEIPLETITYSTNEPDESLPLCDDNYDVLDDSPRAIEIVSQKISGCVQRVGIDQNNAIAVPSNVHLAGWYVNSPLPGQEGVSIIDGHVLGQYGNAIFTNLKDVREGEVVRIQFGDMSWKEFEIIQVLNLSIEETSSQMFEQLSDVERQLTLITCGGSFDKDSQTYERRVLVRARLIE